MKLTKRKRRIPYIPITSFGDIAFLLIIFFVLASVFMKEKDIPYSLAQSRDIDNFENKVVSVVLDKEGKLWLQGQPCAAQALESQVASLVGGLSDKSVMVKIDKDQVQENFEDVLKALSEAGAEIILLGQKE